MSGPDFPLRRAGGLRRCIRRSKPMGSSRLAVLSFVAITTICLPSASWAVLATVYRRRLHRDHRPDRAHRRGELAQRDGEHSEGLHQVQTLAPCPRASRPRMWRRRPSRSGPMWSIRRGRLTSSGWRARGRRRASPRAPRRRSGSWTPPPSPARPATPIVGRRAANSEALAPILNPVLLILGLSASA